MTRLEKNVKDAEEELQAIKTDALDLDEQIAGVRDRLEKKAPPWV